MRLFTNESTGRGWDQNVITHLFLSMLCRQMFFNKCVVCICAGYAEKLRSSVRYSF
jgi:hypothetical protein